MKKQYIVPDMQIVPLKSQGALLSASETLNDGEVGSPEMMPMDADQIHDNIMNEIIGFPY
jgi:hypothetical protein